MELFKAKVTPPREPGDPWTLAEASKRLGVSVRTLTRIEKRGKLRLIRDLGSRPKVPDSEVQRLRK